jgi:hypothetical protein
MKYITNKAGSIGIIPMLILITAIFAVYGKTVYFPFQAFDDPIYVTDNYYVQNGLTIEGAQWAARSLDGANWHPLTWISHMMDLAVFGEKPAGHHLMNILWHMLAAFCLYKFLHALLDSLKWAYIITAIWAIHPANVECVAWISERKTILAEVFMFIGFYFHINYRKKPSTVTYALCLTAQMLASMCKPVAVLFPVALVLIDVARNEKSLCSALNLQSQPGESTQARLRVEGLIKYFIGISASIVIAGLLSWVTYLAQNGQGATNNNQGFIWRVGNCFVSIYFYTIKCFSMPETSVLYILLKISIYELILGVLLVGLFAGLVFVSTKRNRLIAVGIAWYLLMFLPTIGLVQVGSQRLADRYLGLPLIGLLVAIFGLVSSTVRTDRRNRFTNILLLSWCVGLGFQAFYLCGKWCDVRGLSEYAIREGGPSVSMFLNAGVARFNEGDLKGARKCFEKIQESTRASINLAVVDFAEKKYDSAIERTKHILADNEHTVTAAYTAGKAYEGLGRYADALRAYSGAIYALPKKRTYQLGLERLKIVLPLEKRRVEILMAGSKAGDGGAEEK